MSEVPPRYLRELQLEVRSWAREGRLRARSVFSCAWTLGGNPAEEIIVRAEKDAVVLFFATRTSPQANWELVEQRVSVVWTTCHFGGRRPWFICPVYSNGRYCGCRVAKLYLASPWFACRKCSKLAYASQREPPRLGPIRKTQRIRMKLGGSGNLADPFPEKPKRMHWRTYQRLRGEARG
jgi:hypothetical protein